MDQGKELDNNTVEVQKSFTKSFMYLQLIGVIITILVSIFS